MCVDAGAEAREGYGGREPHFRCCCSRCLSLIWCRTRRQRGARSSGGTHALSRSGVASRTRTSDAPNDPRAQRSPAPGVRAGGRGPSTLGQSRHRRAGPASPRPTAGPPPPRLGALAGAPPRPPTRTTGIDVVIDGSCPGHSDSREACPQKHSGHAAQWPISVRQQF